MKTEINTGNAQRKLGLATTILTLLGSFAIGAESGLIVNETYDPPTLNLQGWVGNAENVTRQYITDGVAGSTAMQISGRLLPGSFANVGTHLYHNGLVMGNGRATLENTTLSFDIKVDRPDLVNVQLVLQGWGGYRYSSSPALPKTGSRGRIPLGDYTPGKFKTIVVPLDEPLWQKHPSAEWVAPFDPTAKTYQILFQVDSTGLPSRGDFTVTLDNIKISTAHLMVPWKAFGAAQFKYTLDDEGNLVFATVEEAGVAAHIGHYTAAATFMPGKNTGDIEIKTANGETLFGYMRWLSDTSVVVAIEGGTGQFEGAVGSYLGWLAWIDDLTFTAISEGSISTVGSNMELE